MSGPHPPRPVMVDVAKLAGVSHQTVSRVLNASPNVSAATRARVLAAVRELDYRPNLAARTLVTRRSLTLGVVSFAGTLYGPASMADGLERAARDAGYFVAVASLRSLDARSVQAAVDRLQSQNVEGIAVIAPQTVTTDGASCPASAVPLVMVGTGTPSDVPRVAVDNTAGAALATRHLLRAGHRTVHHLAGPGGWLESRQRTDGWRQALEEGGASEPEVLRGDWSARSGYETGLRIAADPRVTAVFCANDHMAVGLLRALHEADRSVPGDVCVVGFDHITESAYLTPPLTTVRQDFADLGRRAVDILVDEISGISHAGHQVLISPDLVVRASSNGSSGDRVRQPADTPLTTRPLFSSAAAGRPPQRRGRSTAAAHRSCLACGAT